jgi:hypothetical protein
MPAARVTSRLVCGVEIIEGTEYLYIGRPSQQVFPIHNDEEILQEVLE